MINFTALFRLFPDLLDEISQNKQFFDNKIITEIKSFSFWQPSSAFFIYIQLYKIVFLQRVPYINKPLIR